MLASVVEFSEIKRLDVHEAQCTTVASAGLIFKIVAASAKWKIERIRMGEERYLSPMDNVRGETSATLHSDNVWCCTRLDLQVFLKIMRGFRQWSLGELVLGSSVYVYNLPMMRREDWEDLAGLCSRGKIDKVGVWEGALEVGRSQDVEQVKRVAREWDVW